MLAKLLCALTAVCALSNSQLSTLIPPVKHPQTATLTEDEWIVQFAVRPIDDTIFARMQQGGSFPKDCTVKREDLRYLQLPYYNFVGTVEMGELVCNKAIAQDLVEIFRELYKQHYPICHMALIDDYNASDDASMKANNTSAFCFRKVNGSQRLSKHAQGLAVDVNPLDNPCVKYSANGAIQQIEPDTPEARQNAPRSPKKEHTITRDDLCYKLFIEHGFSWGGAWKSKKDYQHFQK